MRKKPSKAKAPTVKERRWAFNHAKEHAIEALTDVLTDEHHSFVAKDGVVRTDLQEIVEAHLEYWLARIKCESTYTGLCGELVRVLQMRDRRRR